jgi:hypothetical protein
MSERLSSLLILLGGMLVIVALWGLTILAVRWDTRRRGLSDLEKQAWLALAIVLPLFGFALYLSLRVLRVYLTPAPLDKSAVDDAKLTAEKARQGEFAARSVGAPRTVSAGQRRPVWVGTPSSRGGVQVYQSGRSTPATVPAVSQSLPAAYSLVVLQGPHLGQQYILNRLPAVIGRGPDSAIPLDADLNVSRRHAEVYEWNGVLRIRDLNSSHGTQVNGQPASDQAIVPGDRIEIGGSILIVRDAV